MHGPAAVDVDRLSGHEIARGRGQEHHCSHQIIRYLHTLDGAAGDPRGEIIRRRRLHLRFALRHAGGNGVHGDAELAELARQSAGEANYTGFRGRVVRRLGVPSHTRDDEMLTILPRPCAFIAGNTARQDRNMPRRLTAMTRSHSSTGISSHERRGRTLISEALLMSTSMLPKRSSAVCAMACVHSSLAISVARPMVSK